MATKTVTTADAPAKPSLREFADKHLNELYDAVALLSAIEDRMSDRNESEHQTSRLASMAKERVLETADAIFAALEGPQANEVAHG